MSTRVATNQKPTKDASLVEVVEQLHGALNAGLPMLSFAPHQLDGAANTAAGDLIDDAWPNQLPDHRSEPLVWTDQLMGKTVLAQMYNVVYHGQVLASPGGTAPFLTTLDSSVRSIAGRAWWQAWLNKKLSAPGALLGGGMHNKAYQTKYVSKEFGGDANFARLFGGEQPPDFFVVRAGKLPTERKEVMEEFVVTAYGATTGIGPRVFAMFFWEGRDKPDKIGGGKLPDPPPYMAKKGFPDAGNPTGAVFSKYNTGNVAMKQLIHQTYYVSEKWTGDCTKIVQQIVGADADRVDPVDFCAAFVPLVMKAARAGVFHGDLKRANLLYRGVGGPTAPLELAYTE